MKNLKFSHRNRRYDLAFNMAPVMQIRGDSGTGKSLMGSDLQAEKEIQKKLSNVLIVNFKTRELLKLLSNNDKEYDFVVIDNADIILTPEYDNLIFEKIIQPTKTQWIILGRKSYNCVISAACRGVLVRQKIANTYYFTIDYTAG